MTVYEAGIDVSRYQGTIDWAGVYRSGIRFALVRLGSTAGGGPYVDPVFRQNVAGAHRAGLKAGAYYYSRARSREESIRELTAYLPALEGLRLEYPVFVDVEDKSQTALDRETLTGLVRFSMDVLYQKGWYGGYYTYTNFAHTYLDTRQLEAYPLWIADYRGYVGFGGKYGLWQYSAAGQVEGIRGAVDLDYSYRDYLPLLRAGGFNGYGPGSDCKAELAAARQKLDRAAELSRQTEELARRTRESLE